MRRRLLMLRVLSLGATAGLFTAGCALPAVFRHTYMEDREYRGWECLVQLPWVANYTAWWANPVFLVGVTLLATGFGRGAGVAGVAASLIAATVLVLPSDIRLLPGYGFWQCAMALLAIAGFHLGRARRAIGRKPASIDDLGGSP